MIIGHLPAGYIIARLYAKRAAPDEKTHNSIMAVGLAASLTPDLDLLYFYAFDRTVHHHLLFPHLPLFWLFSLGVVGLFALCIKSQLLATFTSVAALGILSHLLLDTIAGGIAWALPWDPSLIRLVNIPATHSHFLISFALHWTFLLEISLWVVAIWLYCLPQRPSLKSR